MNYLRAFFFYSLFSLWTILFGTLLIGLAWLPQSMLWRIGTYWRIGFDVHCRVLLGIRCHVNGLENLPPQPSILLVKHQSAWETVALQNFVHRPAFVLKRELFQIPFLGWGLAIMRMIGIDRQSKTSALQQIVEQGKARLAEGRWIIMFPEGTRVAPGKRLPYKRGGAHLAVRTGTWVVPVAHNAGQLWPRNSFAKKPGIITLSFGPPIDPAGLDENQLNARVETWIENEMHRISPESYDQPTAAS